jgi:hypothetical protein
MKCYHLELMLSFWTKFFHLGWNVIIWDAMLSSGANVIIWDHMLSSGRQCYHANVIIWDKMLSSGANVIMVSSGANVIIWCYHVMLSSGMITHSYNHYCTGLSYSRCAFKAILKYCFSLYPPAINNINYPPPPVQFLI